VTSVVPVAAVVTDPLSEPIVATAWLLLLQVPPVGKSLSVIVNPLQMLAGPLMAEGDGFTVILWMAVHPDAV
jgi:hypothetical protein